MNSFFCVPPLEVTGSIPLRLNAIAPMTSVLQKQCFSTKKAKIISPE